MGDTGPIRILIADDHPVLRDGVASVLAKHSDMAVVGEAGDGVAAVALHRELRPDVTLMDLQMPGMDGVEAIEAIRRDFPDAQIIVLTTYAGDFRAMRALKAGASGYILKNSLRSDLIDAIRAVHGGARHLPPELAADVAMCALDEALTPREIDILTLVAAGNANKRIAWKLSISEDTVKTHLKSIFSKLKVTDRTHAVTLAAKRGIIEI